MDKNRVVIGINIVLKDPFYTERGGWPYRYGRVIQKRRNGRFLLGIRVRDGEARFEADADEFEENEHGR